MLGADGNDVAALRLLAIVQRDGGHTDRAAATVARLIALNPGSDVDLRLRGEMLEKSGRIQDALAAFERAHQLAPDLPDALLNVGILLARLDRFVAAIQTLTSVYRRAKLAAGPGNTAIARSAALARKACLARMRRHFESEVEQEATSRPHLRYAGDLARSGEFGEAVEVLTAAKAKFHADSRIPCDLLRFKLLGCDWRNYDRAVADAWSATEIEARDGRKPSLDTLAALCLPLSPKQQLLLGRAIAADAEKRAAGPRPMRTRPMEGADSRITLGYLSARFKDDASAHLMVGLFGRHDRRRFRVICYSLGPDDGSIYRRRVMTESDRFVDLHGVTDAAAAARIRADAVDILVDIDGFNPDARPVVAAMRPAPVQVRFLDYPATTGAAFFDYYLTDRVATPPGSEGDWTEQLVFLPDTYQANDCDQPIRPCPGGRAGQMLAEDVFVFASFCSMRKFEPVVFDAWMEILRRTDNSVLWVLPFTADAARNLRREAAARGVPEGRLVFARYMKKPEHLGRVALADLSLDTLYWGGHTTSSDALWAGVPLITTPGNTFASRVAASLLHAVGLPELVAPTLADYVDLAVSLAADRERLAELRQRLARNRLTMPLFDTARFVRSLERAYSNIWAIHRQGASPRGFALDPEPLTAGTA